METDFKSMSLTELRKEAGRLGIEGRSKMNQQQLIKALKADEERRAEENKQIVVCVPSVGEPLIIRSNPTDEEVRGFVAEHNRRNEAGEAGGPDGYPAVRILEAVRYPDELAFKYGAVDAVGEPIDLG